MRGGGGRIQKPVRGTPSKLNIKNKIKLFEGVASEAVSKGLAGLGQWSGKLFNPDYNLTAGGGGGGTQLDSEICASQPERGTRTRPRDAAILAGLGGTSQPGIGAEMPAWVSPTNEMHWARGQP